MKGVYNATAPNPVTMRDLCSSIGRQSGRPSWLPVPEFVIKAVLGKIASYFILYVYDLSILVPDLFCNPLLNPISKLDIALLFNKILIHLAF